MTVFPKSGGLAEPAAAVDTRSDTACQIKTLKGDHTESAVGPQSQRDGPQRNESWSPRFT
ncbi:hypothetical protein WN944_025718 [Citrus x changshan-huyou]|uniref:Uncharacterized protein n=1 Tax=Citrus x changshan-huyou TaxID=2935761 RepID=A0AAP0LQD3_9ROSI